MFFYMIDYLILLLAHTDCAADTIYILHYTNLHPCLHHFPEDILYRIMLHDFHTKLFELKKITSNIVMAKYWDIDFIIGTRFLKLTLLGFLIAVEISYYT